MLVVCSAKYFSAIPHQTKNDHWAERNFFERAGNSLMAKLVFRKKLRKTIVQLGSPVFHLNEGITANSNVGEGEVRGTSRTSDPGAEEHTKADQTLTD